MEHNQHLQKKQQEEHKKQVSVSPNKRFNQKVSVVATKNKFVGVRQRPSGKWVAEIKDTTHKIRIWLGTFPTAEEAARAYDEAACLLRGSNTKTNFNTRTSSSSNSPISMKIRNLLNQRKNLKDDHVNHAHPSTGSTTKTNSIVKASTIVSSSAIRFPFSNNTSNVDTLQSKNYENMLDDVYRPDLRSCSSDGSPEQSIPQFYPTWQLQFSSAAHQQLQLMQQGTVLSDDMPVLEFERVKVERQISASLYAINGLNDYMEINAINNAHYDPSADALWDLPSLLSTGCYVEN